MKIVIALMFCLVSAGVVRAAFESLPGPAPGCASVWAWPLREARAAPWSGGLSLGHPAAVDDLVWTHAWGGRRIAKVDCLAELFSFGLDDIYREGIAGLWVSTRGIGVGLRRWQVTWADGLQRHGWTASAEVLLRRGRTSGRVVAQDLAVSQSDRTAPRPTLAAICSRPIGSTLDAAAAVRRSRLGGAFVWRLRWTPVPCLGLTEEFLTPGTFTSGVELRTSRLRAGLWYAPLAAIGARTGVSLSWGA